MPAIARLEDSQAPALLASPDAWHGALATGGRDFAERTGVRFGIMRLRGDRGGRLIWSIERADFSHTYHSGWFWTRGPETSWHDTKSPSPESDLVDWQDSQLGRLGIVTANLANIAQALVQRSAATKAA